MSASALSGGFSGGADIRFYTRVDEAIEIRVAGVERLFFHAGRKQTGAVKAASMREIVRGNRSDFPVFEQKIK